MASSDSENSPLYVETSDSEIPLVIETSDVSGDEIVISTSEAECSDTYPSSDEEYISESQIRLAWRSNHTIEEAAEAIS